MIIDMHMHEMRYSGDSFLRLENMVEIAKRRGLDGICITDHDSMGLKEFAAEYSEKTGFPIFVGIEFYSLQGDIVAFGIEDYPKERIPAQEFVDLVQAQGGMCFSAHPFRNNNRGLEENLKIVKGLDGIEVLNGKAHFMRQIERRQNMRLSLDLQQLDQVIAMCRRSWEFMQRIFQERSVRYRN